MKKTKKFWAVLAAAGLVAASLAGCGNSTSNSTSNGTESNSGSASAASSSSVASSSTADSGEKKVIKAVTSGTLAPYFYVNDDNELTGVDIDIVKEVFNRLPQYELQIDQADALQGVLSGQYDIAVNNYGYTDERAETYYFSLPYKTSFNEYIQRADDEPLTSLTDLADRGYKIELGAGSLTANALEKWNEDNPDHQINIVYSNTNFQVRYQHIVDGTTDVAIDDGPIIDNLLPQFGLEGQLVANEIDEETEDFLFPQNNTYFLFGKNEEGAALREDVDKALKEMKEDGTLSKITTEYLGVDTSPDEKYFEETPN